MEIKGLWDFIQNYYPNYYSCDTIAYEDDLQKLIDGEYEDGDCAHKLLMDEYEGDLDNPAIIKDHNDALIDIYKRAIEGFIAEQNFN